MYHPFKICCVLPFMASPGNSIYDELLRSTGWGRQRRSNTLVPAYSIYAGIEDPPAPPRRPIPTDVPVKEPIDVPLRAPRDVPPPPEPEKRTPPPMSEPHDSSPGAQPRPIS